MSDPSILPGPPDPGPLGEEPDPRPVRPPRRRRGSGCLPMLVFVLVGALVVAGAGWFLVKPWVDSLFGDPEDFAGPGSGQVCFVVMEGDTVGSVADRLADLGVVASSEAFRNAAETSEASVFPGSYPLREGMPAAAAVTVLGEMGNGGCLTELTFLPGKTVEETVRLLAKNTDFRRAQYDRVLAHPAGLGLPAGADGNAEGYLFPGSYTVTPDDTPRSILKAMVDRWHLQDEKLGIAEGAAELGYTTHELMTIASLVEAEGSTLSEEDKAKIARVIYNRLEKPSAETAGFLQIDATVAYALGYNPGVALTEEELNVDSPYNTRRYQGLPPGPIESPGSESIEAALHPADGDWLYYVTVDLATGETKFATTHDEFLTYKAEYTEYCETSDAC